MFRPKANFGEDSFVATDKFAEDTAVSLGMNCSTKNLHPWNPDFFNVRFASVCGREFSGIDSGGGHLLRERTCLVVARGERSLGGTAQPRPSFPFTLVHVDLTKQFNCLTKNRRAREKDLDCNRGRAATVVAIVAV